MRPEGILTVIGAGPGDPELLTLKGKRLIEEADEPLVIPAPVLVEVDYWVHVRLYAGVFAALLHDITSGA